MLASPLPLTNWAGNQRWSPAERRAPATLGDVVDVVTAAHRGGRRVKVIGGGIKLHRLNDALAFCHHPIWGRSLTLSVTHLPQIGDVPALPSAG